MGFSRWERRAGYSGALVVWEGFQAVSSSPERFRGCFGRRAVVPPLPVAVVVPSPADSVGSAPLLRFVPAAFAGCEPWEDSLGGSVWVVVCVEEPASSLVFWLGAMPSAVAGPWVRLPSGHGLRPWWPLRGRRLPQYRFRVSGRLIRGVGWSRRSFSA
jgi:hypothetical protein